MVFEPIWQISTVKARFWPWHCRGQVLKIFEVVPSWLGSAPPPNGASLAPPNDSCYQALTSVSGYEAQASVAT